MTRLTDCSLVQEGEVSRIVIFPEKVVEKYMGFILRVEVL